MNKIQAMKMLKMLNFRKANQGVNLLKKLIKIKLRVKAKVKVKVLL